MPTLADLVSGIRGYFNVGDGANPQFSQGNALAGRPPPVAYTRITRTPVIATDTLPESAGAQYHAMPWERTITVRPSELQDYPNNVIPHESGHAVYDQANLTPGMVGTVPSSAHDRMTIHPELYQPLPPHPTPEQVEAYRQMNANEGLAYSIGDLNATPFIERVASQIKDPKMAEKLRRLHYNALATRKLR